MQFIDSGVFGFTVARDTTYKITSVPEASTWAMMALALALAGNASPSGRSVNAAEQLSLRE